MTDPIFRTKVSLNLSLGINLLYIAINLLSWHLYQSWWFICLAVYYAILSVMRFLLVRYVRLNEIGANRRGELKRALACSSIMLTGAGMSLFMSDLGQLLGLLPNLAMVIGIFVGLMGLVLVALAYPLHNHILKKERQRIAPEILRLTDDLMK